MQPLGWLVITVTDNSRTRDRKFRRGQEVEVETGSVLSYDLL